MMGNRNRTFSASIVIYLLALMYLGTGISKLIQANTQVNDFESWGYSTGFMLAIGVVEILGAVGLLIAKTRFIAILVLAGIMFGAIGTHIVHAEYLNALLPLVLLVLLTFVFLRNKSTIEAANLTEDDQAEY